MNTELLILSNSILLVSTVASFAAWIVTSFKNRDLQKEVDNTTRDYQEANARWRDQNFKIGSQLSRVAALLDKEEEGKA